MSARSRLSHDLLKMSCRDLLRVRAKLLYRALPARAIFFGFNACLGCRSAALTGMQVVGSPASNDRT